MAENIFDAMLAPYEQPSKEKAARLAASLRRDSDFGTIMQLMGTPATTQAGSGLQKQAYAGLQMAAERDRQAAADAVATARWNAQQEQAKEEREYRRGVDARNYGLQQANLGLRQAAATRADLGAQAAREAKDAATAAKQQAVDAKNLAAQQVRDNAMATADMIVNTLDRAITHPGRVTATGWSSLNPLNMLPHTKEADYRAVRDQIRGQSFLQAFESLKGGGGSITDAEGKKATAAITVLADSNLTEEAELQALQDLREVAEARRTRLQGYAAKAGGGGATGVAPPAGSPAGGAPAASGKVPTFATEAEAEAAGIKPGTKVIIGGVPGTWQ